MASRVPAAEGLSVVTYAWIAALVGALLMGWVAGMCTFKRSQRWCPVHGVTLLCLECRTHLRERHLYPR